MNYHRKDIGEHIETIFRAVQEHLREKHHKDLREAQFAARKTNNGAALLPAEAASYIRHTKALTIARAQAIADAYTAFREPSGDAGAKDLTHYYNTILAARRSAFQGNATGVARRTGRDLGQLSGLLRSFERDAQIALLEGKSILSKQTIASLNHAAALPATNPLLSPEIPEDLPMPDQTAASRNPTAFISYSWDSDEHQRWVIGLATELRRSGIDVTLDYWHLDLGADKTHFMEDAVAESDHVLLICTPNFANRANGRRGGVGWETSIVTGELADDLMQTKFIPVLREGNWKDSPPRWLKNRLGVDLTGDPYSKKEYDRLLRKLHRATPQPPALGPRPTFDDSPENALSLSPAPAPSPALAPKPAAPSFEETKPQDGPGRFRPKGVALGAKWDDLSAKHREIHLAEGSAVWLRLAPTTQPDREWSPVDLKKFAMQDGSWLLPFTGSRWWSLRADDGYGIYSSFDSTSDNAFSVAFAFETGEVWSIDTQLLSYDDKIYLPEIAKGMVSKLPDYAGLLGKLGISGPYQWIAGLDGVKHKRLVRAARQNAFADPECVAENFLARGSFTAGEDPNAALHPFFKCLYEKCGLDAPAIPQIGISGDGSRPKANAIAYAFYDLKGTAEKAQVYVRPSMQRNGLYLIESSTGEETEGTKAQIAQRLLSIDLELRAQGYIRMSASNAAGDSIFSLP